MSSNQAIDERDQPVSRSMTDAEHDTLAEEQPAPLKPAPTDPEKGEDSKKGEAGARWRDAEVHEIPYK